MKTATVAAAAIVAALATASSALAYTTGDLAALGYAVGVSSTYNGDQCTVYSISGYGVSTYADSCAPGFQASIDQLYQAAANPASPPAPAPIPPPGPPPAPVPPTTAPAPPMQASSSGTTLDDLDVRGYQISVASSQGGCTVYWISGFGVGTYLSTCDPGYQAALDAFAALADGPAAPADVPAAPAPAAPAQPSTASAPAAAPTVDAGTVPDSPLTLARALQGIVGHPVRVTAATRCYLGHRRVVCSALAKKVRGSHVKVWTRGRVLNPRRRRLRLRGEALGRE